MHILLIIGLALFGVIAGLFLGAGNYSGLKGSLLPGLMAGLLIAIPCIRESNWLTAALLAGFALVGSVIATLVSDRNRLKRFCREQRNLVIHCGSYRLGRDRNR